MRLAPRLALLALAGAVPFGLGIASRRPRLALGGPDAFPDVPLLTHEGKPVRFYEDLVRGKTVAIHFFYSKCQGVCPGTVANLLEVQRILGERMGKEVHFLSISLKPWEDTPEALAAYARGIGAGPGWTFVTGERDDLERIRRRLGFVDPDPQVDADASQHMGMVLYGNEPRRSWAACPGLSRPGLLAEQILWMVPS